MRRFRFLARPQSSQGRPGKNTGARGACGLASGVFHPRALLSVISRLSRPRTGRKDSLEKVGLFEKNRNNKNRDRRREARTRFCDRSHTIINHYRRASIKTLHSASLPTPKAELSRLKRGKHRQRSAAHAGGRAPVRAERLRVAVAFFGRFRRPRRAPRPNATRQSNQPCRRARA